MSADEKYTISVNPATGEEIGRTKENTVEDLQAAVAKARVAQKVWAAKSFSERAEHLYAIRNYIADHSGKIAETISKDSGKTRIDALSTEVLPTTMAITYYAKNARKFLKRKKLSAGNLLTINKKSYIDYVPYGIIGIISPWNYPFGIPFHEIAMALISGNAVILKVATQTLEVGKIIEECVNAGNLPDGLFHHLNIPGKIAGDAFIDSGINKIFFTGSVPVGKYLMKKASEKLLPLSLELGGNDAMIVCRDADIKRAAAGALWAGLSNSGQSCAGVERILVDEFIYKEFMRELKKQLLTLRQGPDTDFNVEIGSLTTESQMNTVKTHLQDAIRKGASVFAGQAKTGENNVGLFVTPAILENVDMSMLTMREETFGPLLAVDSFSTIEEAIAKANNSNLGLTSSVWTQNKTLAHKTASRIEAGTVMINDHLMSHGLAETPWGGFKQSGLGRTHSYIGLEEMTQPRCVVDDIMPGMKKNFWWYPHSPKVYEALNGAIQFLYSRDLAKRFNGVLKLVPQFLGCFKNSSDK
jgi:acyl-CoA reductase-like NAD-dependent aldehyde dehydrogenase